LRLPARPPCGEGFHNAGKPGFGSCAIGKRGERGRAAWLPPCVLYLEKRRGEDKIVPAKGV